MKIFLTACAAGMLLLSISCHDQAKNSEVADMKIERLEEERESANDNGFKIGILDTIAQPAISTSTQHGIQTPTQHAVIDWDKKIIKNAKLTVEVSDFNSFSKNLRLKIKQVGGYISSESHQLSEYKTEDVLTIKVPVAQFEEALNIITADNTKIVGKSITTDDVTGTILDTKSRLEAKRTIRLRYLDLLKQAKTMDEILKVQSEINDIQEEMEAASGRIGYLSHSSAFSTIELTCSQVLNPSLKPNDNPSFLTEIKSAFSNGAKWTGDILIGLIAVWPLWMVLFFVWIAYRKWSTPKKAAA